MWRGLARGVTGDVGTASAQREQAGAVGRVWGGGGNCRVLGVGFWKAPPSGGCSSCTRAGSWTPSFRGRACDLPLCTGGRWTQEASEAHAWLSPRPSGPLGTEGGRVGRGHEVPGVPVPTPHRALEGEALECGLHCHPQGKMGSRSPMELQRGMEPSGGTPLSCPAWGSKPRDVAVFPSHQWLQPPLLTSFRRW